MVGKAGAWFLICSFAMTPAFPDSDRLYVEYLGIASSPKSAKFLYTERHFLTYRGERLTDRVVLYGCADGSPFARKTASYIDPLAPNFLLEDSTTGLREGVQGSGALRTVFFRISYDLPQKSAALALSDSLVIDSGFDAFIRSNWSQLMAGRAVPMRFLVPSRLEEMDFKVQHLRRIRQGGTDAEVFRLKVSGVLGWVVAGIDVTYSAEQHVLLRYQGVADMHDGAGENVQADINFRSQDRSFTDEQAAAAAMRMPVAPCKG